MYFNMVYPQIRVDIINTSIDVVVAKFVANINETNVFRLISEDVFSS